jgi:iron complex outermembrane recepter protein
MEFHKKPIAAAVSLALLGLTAPTLALAQAAPATPPAAETKKAGPKKPEAEVIVVTGIRASLERSIQTKIDADTNVEVVSAEDVGKMPDKNIADALSRLTGVNV